MKTKIAIIAACTSLFAVQGAFAEKNHSSSSSSLSADSSDHKNVISPLLGWASAGANYLTDSVNGTDTGSSMVLSGLFGLGFDYEYMLKDDFSVGGFFRYYTTSDTIGTTGGGDEDITETAFLLGGLAHAYVFKTEHFSGYIGSGITAIKISQKLTPKSGNSNTLSPAMTLGFPFAIGVGYKFNETLTFGIEHLSVMALGDKVQGWPVSDFMMRLAIAL